MDSSTEERKNGTQINLSGRWTLSKLDLQTALPIIPIKKKYMDALDGFEEKNTIIDYPLRYSDVNPGHVFDAISLLDNFKIDYSKFYKSDPFAFRLRVRKISKEELETFCLSLLTKYSTLKRQHMHHEILANMAHLNNYILAVSESINKGFSDDRLRIDKTEIKKYHPIQNVKTRR